MIWTGLRLSVFPTQVSQIQAISGPSQAGKPFALQISLTQKLLKYPVISEPLKWADGHSPVSGDKSSYHKSRPQQF